MLLFSWASAIINWYDNEQGGRGNFSMNPAWLATLLETGADMKRAAAFSGNSALYRKLLLKFPRNGYL